MRGHRAKSIFLRGLSLVSLLGILATLNGCKTSGSLRNSPTDSKGAKENKTTENEEIKTVANPQLAKPSADQLEKELALTRGRLSEVETLRKMEREKLEARIAQLEEQNSELLKGIAVAQSKKPAPQAREKKDGFKLLWDQAIKQSKAKNYKASLGLFREIRQQYPTKSGSSYAIFGQAFSEYALGEYRKAALNFNEILENYPKHKQRSLASFGLGACFHNMQQREDAKLFFDEAKTIAPRKAHGRLATQILANQAQVPKDLFEAFPDWFH